MPRPAIAVGRIFQSPYPAWARPKIAELTARSPRPGTRAARGESRLIDPPTRYRREPETYRPFDVPAGTRPFRTFAPRRARDPTISGRPMRRTRKTTSSYTGAFRRSHSRYHGGISEKNGGS